MLSSVTTHLQSKYTQEEIIAFENLLAQHNIDQNSAQEIFKGFSKKQKQRWEMYVEDLVAMADPEKLHEIQQTNCSSSQTNNEETVNSTIEEKQSFEFIKPFTPIFDRSHSNIRNNPSKLEQRKRGKSSNSSSEDEHIERASSKKTLKCPTCSLF